PPPSVRVLSAARDLPAGTPLTAADLGHVDLPPPAVPSGALRSSAVGRVLAGPMRKGEPLTDARVLGEALLKGYAPGTAATPIRIADRAAARLLHPGDRIDVLSAPPAEGPEQHGARVVVSGVPVVAIPPAVEDGGQEGALIVLATDRAQALALAAAPQPLSLTITAN
ncbi:Flp pilus assembly protein CpaB, partial [Actinomadura bangladeshensis]